MVTINEFSNVVSEVYASSVNPANWTVALAEISRILDATGSGLILGGDDGRSMMLGATMPAEAVTSYQQYYHSIDFVLEACERSPVGLILGGQDIAADKTRSEFYGDWQSPYELTDGLFVRLSAGPAPASLAISGPRRSERFDTHERVRFISALIRHLQQALRMQRHVAEVNHPAVPRAGTARHHRSEVRVLAPRYSHWLNADKPHYVNSATPDGWRANGFGRSSLRTQPLVVWVGNRT